MPGDAIEPPTHVDVIVVGAGYAGLGAAIPLSRAGRRVLVLERNLPGYGASTRNGGISSGNIRGSFTELEQAYGLQRTIDIFAEAVAARQDLHDFVAREDIDCDDHLTGRLVGIMDAKQIDAIKADAELMHRHTGIQSRIIDRSDLHAEIGTDIYAGGVLRDDIGGVHPAKLHRGLLQVAKKSGCEVIGNLGVDKIVRETKGFSVHTAKGAITAANVIVTTNGYTDTGLPWLRRRLVPVISEIIATDPIEPSLMAQLSPRRRMYGENRILGHYYRPSPDGTRFLLGGRRYHNDPEKGRQRLRQALIEIFPDLADIGISHHWFGYVAYPMNKLPKLTTHKGVIYASGFCGSGVVWARWLGQKAAGLVLEPEEVTSAFRTEHLHAIPLYNGKPWFLPITMAWYQLKDRFG